MLLLASRRVGQVLSQARSKLFQCRNVPVSQSLGKSGAFNLSWEESRVSMAGEGTAQPGMPAGWDGGCQTGGCIYKYLYVCTCVSVCLYTFIELRT